MYLDDGVSRSSAWTDPANPGVDPRANDEYREVEIRHETLSKTPLKRQITIKRRHQGFTPLETYYFVAVLHDPGISEGGSGPLNRVALNSRQIFQIVDNTPEDRADRLAAHGQDAYYYNENIHITFIKVFDTMDELTIELDYEG